MTAGANLTMYELTSSPVTEESGPGYDFIPDGIYMREDIARWEMSGLEKPVEAGYRNFLPKRVILHWTSPQIYDFITTKRLPLVSPNFKAILESIEPGTHEYLNIDVHLSKFPSIILPDYYFLNIAKINDGLDFERCPKGISRPPPLPEEMLAKYGQLQLQPRPHLWFGAGRGRVFNASAVHGRHLFSVWNKLCAWAPTFLSPTLMDLCQRNEISGLAAVACRAD